MKFKIIITENGKMLDVTGKSAIYYGIGERCIELHHALQLPNVRHVIDGDENKWGRTVQLSNKKYIIESPEILKELCHESHYIMISSSSKHVKEIEDSIRKHGGAFPVCKGIEHIFYVYQSLSDLLLYDPMVRKKITQQHVDVLLDQYMAKSNSIMTHYLDGSMIEYFIPIKRGHRIAIILGNKENQWVLGMPVVFSIGADQKRSWGWMTKDIDHREQVFYIKTKHRLQENLTIYEDGEGFSLEHYANDAIDCSAGAIREKILKKCHEIHQIRESPKLEIDVTARYDELMACLGGWSVVESRLIENMRPYLRFLRNMNSGRKLCHGDLHPGNIVSKNGKVFFIDWEFMCTADPMYDVGRVLYYSSFDEYSSDLASYDEAINGLYRNLPDYLSVYYGRKCTKEEYDHIFAMMLFCESIEWLLSVIHRKRDAKEMAAIILDHMKRYKKEGEWI